MNNLDMKTPNFTDNNIEQIAKLFPNCLTEIEDEKGNLKKAINFDLLKQELSANIVDGTKERYSLNWPGKKEALLKANEPINKTLRPCEEESVNFEDTENLYIEGDNLEVLKLLQESYLNKIKMIYIDPPYNTGNDFVYNDNFTINKDEEMESSGQINEEKGKLVTNPNSNGRYHSDWLSMMYPRLKLARNLLIDDGVICISIDDNEITNMKKLCDEIFGEENFIIKFITVSNPRGRQTTRLPFALTHEYILVYSKNINHVSLNFMELNEKQRAEYRLSDDIGKYRLLGLRKRGTASDRKDRPNLFYPIYYNIETNEFSTKFLENSIEILPKKEDRSDGVWRWQKSKVETTKNKLFIKQVKRKSGELEYDVFVKDYLNNDGEEKGSKYKSLLDNKEYNNEKGTEAVKELFNGKKVFDFPKPIALIKTLLNFGSKDGLILDFFAGSGTTAQSVMEINLEDNGDRKFICVQIAEILNDPVIIDNIEYKTISQITKERIRRAGTKILKTNNDNEVIENLDIGFRVFKVDSSNMKDVYYNPDQIDQTQLTGLIDNIKDGRSAEDLLFQVLLDWGVDLTLSIKKDTLCEHEVYFVDDDALGACFETIKDDEFITALAKKELLRVVFKDNSFKDDDMRINVEQIFKQYSPDTQIKVI